MKDEIDRTIAERTKKTGRFRFNRTPRVFTRSGEYQVVSKIDIAVVGDTQFDLDAGARVGERPIDHAACNKVFVGHKNFFAVECFDQRIARAGTPNITKSAVGEFDKVTLLDRFLHKENEARDEVGGNFLQAKAEPDTHRATEDRKRSEVDTDKIEPDKKGNEVDNNLCKLQNQGAVCRAHALDSGNPMLYGVDNYRRCPKHQRNRNHRTQQGIGRKTKTADTQCKRRRIEHLAHRVEIA